MSEEGGKKIMSYLHRYPITVLKINKILLSTVISVRQRTVLKPFGFALQRYAFFLNQTS